MIQQRRHLMVPALTFGSGGGIRTPDLWVMSPTSCRCSTPRRVRGYLAMSQELLALGSDRLPDASTPRVGGARGGLASRGVAPTVLSGAALGHDRVRDGTGWGQHALGHGHPPPPHRRPGSPLSASLSALLRFATRRHTSHGEPAPRSCPLARAPCPAPSRFCVSVAQARPSEGAPLPLARAAPLSGHDAGGIDRRISALDH